MRIYVNGWDGSAANLMIGISQMLVVEEECCLHSPSSLLFTHRNPLHAPIQSPTPHPALPTVALMGCFLVQALGRLYTKWVEFCTLHMSLA